MFDNNKILEQALMKLIRKNALVLFDLQGNQLKFDYQRHITSSLNDIPGSNKKIKILNSLLITFGLWVSWENHLIKSKYNYDCFGCVQIGNDWLLKGNGTPPYVILNSERPDAVRSNTHFKLEKLEMFPIKIESYLPIGTLCFENISVSKACFHEDDGIEIVWRFSRTDW